MKTKNKVLILSLCAMLLVVASVLGTLAYLTDQDSVNNTFTVGNVDLRLDEAKVDEYGVPIPDAARVQANGYKLVPGHEYTKDPTVHVTAGSENSYIFVKIENGIAGIEADTVAGGYQNIAKQVLDNGWTLLEEVGDVGVYYQAWPNLEGDNDLVVFSEFKIADGVNATTLGGYANASIVVTAYAIQAEGFADANAAWDALQEQYPAPTENQ